MRRLLLILFVMPLALLSLSRSAIAYQNWSYGYTGFNPFYSYDYETQFTSAYRARFWPAPGYSTSSTYYRLGNSLSSEFKAAARSSASAWSQPSTNFHYYELPLGSNQYDRTLGMADLGSGGALGAAWVMHPWNSGSVRHEVSTWYIRFEANLYKYGLYWTVGASPGAIDIQDVVTHEMGHPIDLIDVDFSGARETMDWESIPNSTARRTLATGDNTGVSNLYN